MLTPGASGGRAAPVVRQALLRLCRNRVKISLVAALNGPNGQPGANGINRNGHTIRH